MIAYMKKTSLTFKNNKKYTLKLHQYLPDEREANIESSKLIYDFCLKNFNNDKKLLSYTSDNLNYFLSNGYTDNSCPIDFLMKNTDLIIDPIIITKLDELSKIKYGFSVEHIPTKDIFYKNKVLLKS